MACALAPTVASSLDEGERFNLGAQMANLLPLPGDKRGRIVCSECLRCGRGDRERQYLFEFADCERFGNDDFQLFGKLGELWRQAPPGPNARYRCGVAQEATLVYVSCRLDAGGQRRPGEPVPSRSGTD